MIDMTSTPRIALITGGNRGIGRSAALHLADAGSGVVITYNSHADEAEQVVAELRERGVAAAALQLHQGDVAAFPAFAQQLDATLRETFGRDDFDHLVLNGGFSRGGNIATITTEDFDDLVDVHLKGPLFLTKELAPRIADGGAIVTLSSGLARFTFPERMMYGSVKGAVEVLTRYLAAELGPRGIRVNCVAPGAVATDFSGGMVRDTPAAQESLAAAAALGRHAVADDIGPVIASLLSDANHWVTGQRIEASGGVHL
ncbi:SDR family oxidoreductase [Conexibacter woesei]|uniref:SDR family NAD(P)-dependent oxidoreductase n=1 Tax=Conexibacter woesei TaxID=191495 RepID=UPI00040A0319